MRIFNVVVWALALFLAPQVGHPAAAVFSGSNVKILKDNLDMNGKGEILSGTTDPTSSAVSARMGALYLNTSNGNLYRKLDSGSSTNWTQVGSGASGKNYITNTGAEANVTGAVAYADAAGTSPVNGVDGSPTLTITRTTSSPLSGTGSYLITKDAANRQGEGIAWTFAPDRADFAKPLRVSFDYELASGTFTSGDSSDLRVWVYDVTNSALIPVSPFTIQGAGATGTQHRFVGYFQTSATGTSYRLILHQGTTSASAYTFKLDSLYVGPDATVVGAPISDWQSFTPTGSWVANTTYTGMWRRIGDTMQIQYRLALSGAPTSTSLTVNLPSGYSIDTTKLPDTTNQIQILGFASLADSAGGNGTQLGRAVYNSATSFSMGYYDDTATAVAVAGAVTQAAPFTWASGDSVTIFVNVPIVGWASTVVMSNDTDTRVAVAIASGDAASAADGAPIIWPTTNTDTHGGYASGRYTVPISGFWRITATIVSSDAARQLFANVNAVDTRLIGTTDSNGELSSSAIVKVNAGDILDVRPDGGALDVTSGVSYVSFERITGPATIGATDTVSASYATNAAQSITNSGADVLVDIEDREYDATNSVTTGASWRFIAPISGRYAIKSHFEFTSSAYGSGNQATLSLYKNGSLYRQLGRNVLQAAVTMQLVVAGATELRLLAGEYVDFRVSNNRTAGATQLRGDASHNYATVTRVGNY